MTTGLDKVYRRVGPLLRAGQDKLLALSGRDRAPLDPHVLLGQARQRNLLEDFGAGDFREGFDTLVAALNEGDLAPGEQRRASEILVERLGSRLRVRDWVKKNPTVSDESIRDPILVTGTDPAAVTLLGRVLAADVMNRAPLRWEAVHVAPPPSVLARGHDRRITTIKDLDPTGPVSCAALLAPSFADSFAGYWPVPQYWKWWLATDHTAAYAFHRLQLQILQNSYATGQWVLHSAAHLWHLDALLATYPDARVIWIHRDPAHVMARALGRPSKVGSGSSGSSPAHITDCLQRMLSAALDARQRHPETSFFDLQYVELIDDPVGAVERAYRDWQIVLSELSRWRMQAVLEENGVLPDPVAVAPAEVERLRSEFATYVSAFEVPSEVRSA